MWYVERVWTSSPTGRMVQTQCLHCDNQHRLDDVDAVSLKNSETGDTVYLSSDTLKELFEYEIRKYYPWGYARGREIDGWSGDWFILRQIDELSLKFHATVKSIDAVSNKDEEAREFIRNLRPWVTVWGVDNFIFEWNSRIGHSFYCFTLFQIICGCKEGWLNDKYYMRVGVGRDICTGICVTFDDLRAARALLGKAIVTGYNPLDEASKFRFASRGKA